MQRASVPGRCHNRPTVDRALLYAAKSDSILPRVPGEPESATKKKKKATCQTSINARPDRAPEGKTSKTGAEIITALYTAAARVWAATLAGSARTTRVFTLGREDL